MEHQADLRCQRARLKRHCHGPRHTVGNDVDQTASAESHHGGAAGMGCEAGVGQVDLEVMDHRHIGGGITVQDEVV